jgi:hypothetical protein
MKNYKIQKMATEKNTSTLAKYQFSEKHLVGLCKDNKIDEAKKYISSFFFRSGSTILKKCHDGTYDNFEHKDIKSNMPKDAVVYNGKHKVFDACEYFKTSEFMEKNYRPSIDMSRTEKFFTETKQLFDEEGECIKDEDDNDLITTDYIINMAKPLGIKRKAIKNFDKMKAEIGTKKILKHIEEILCSSDEKVYEYFLNFIACTFAGKKLRTNLYMQSAEGTGKGIIMNFLAEILGERYLSTSTFDTLEEHTKPMEGRSLIVLDEMPVAKNDFKDFLDVLKNLTTEPTFMCRDKYLRAYVQKNTFNIVITTNNNAIVITNTNKRRYNVLDVSNKRVGDIKYFEELATYTNDVSVQKHFYDIMIERYNNIKDSWNEDTKPDTKSKDIKMIEGLSKFLKWIKSNYIMRGLGIDKIPTTELYNKYNKYSSENKSATALGKELKEIGLHYKKFSDGSYRYNYSHKHLYDLFIEKKFIDPEYEHVQAYNYFESDEIHEIEEVETHTSKQKQKSTINSDMKAILKLHEMSNKIVQQQLKESDIIINAKLDNTVVKKIKKQKKSSVSLVEKETIDTMFD